MELLRTSIIFFLINLAKTKKFYISHDVSNSSQAQELCDLAVPELRYTSRRTVQLNKAEIEGNISHGETFWIGYMREYAAFLYRGCMEKSDIQREPDWTSARSPGLCYSFCSGRFIGVEGRRCYCLTSISDGIKNEDCETTCDFPQKTACGKNDEYVALYEKVPYPSNNSENGFCRAYNADTESFFWAECNTQNKVLCTKDNNSTNIRDYNVKNTDGEWLTTNNICLKDDRYPVREQDNFLPTHSPRRQRWTGSIRTFIFLPVAGKPSSWFAEDTGGTKEGFRQGYIQYDLKADEFVLMFNYQNDTRNALCQSGPTTASSTSSTVQATTTTAFQNKTTSTRRPSSAQTSESPNTTGPDSPEYNIGPRINREKTNLVGVYVAVPLTLILVAAIVGFFLFRKRKRQAANKPKGKGAIRKDKTRSVGIGNALPNAAYQDDFQIGMKQEIVEHNYQILEPANIYSSIDDTVSTTDENEYNTTYTGTVNSHVVADKAGNIYNKFDDESEDTYNHTNITSSRHDDTYNHTEDSSKKEAMCDLNGVNRPTNDSSNDTYSHLEVTGMNGNSLLTNPINFTTNVVDDTYNHTEDQISGTQQSSFNSNVNSKLLPKFSDSTSCNVKPSYDYAYVIQVGHSGVSNSSAFTVNQTPASGTYEFAKEPADSDYELAKPTNNYLELQNDE